VIFFERGSMVDPEDIYISYVRMYSWFLRLCIKNSVKISQPTSCQVTGEIITNIKRKKSEYS